MADLQLAAYFAPRLLALRVLRSLDWQEVLDLHTIRQYETEVAAFRAGTAPEGP